jgi:hypothetical protein
MRNARPKARSGIAAWTLAGRVKLSIESLRAYVRRRNRV